MRRRFYTNKKNILPLYIEAKEDGVCFLSLNGAITVYYRIDMGDWIALGASAYSQSISKGQRLYIKSNTPFTFSITGRCKIGGDIRSIKYGDNYKIFNGGNYSRVFAKCTTIEEVDPNLLQYVTDLSDYCFYSMFEGCTSLVNAPELPATTLYSHCYEFMFSGCSSLTTAPELPATTLVDSCYSSMFNECSKLNYIKMLATDISANNCLFAWVRLVASTGTFVKNPEATWEVYGDRGIPNGWEVVMDGEESNLKSFQVDNMGDVEEFYFEDGMTWGEWVDSEYNNGDYAIDEVDGSICKLQFGMSAGWIGNDYGYVLSSDTILEGTYYLMS